MPACIQEASLFLQQLLLRSTSTGFKDPFTDNIGPGNSPNQVHHYVGTFQAGYAGASRIEYTAGYRVGLLVANDHETVYGIKRGARGGYESYPLPDTPTHAADKRLNRLSVSHGALLGAGSFKPGELGNLLRRDVCQ